MEATKRATRDYPAFSRTPWKLWEVIYARRSHRKFLSSELEGEFAASLGQTVQLAVSTRGAPAQSILVAMDNERVEKIQRGALKGVQGKINLWLSRTPVGGFLVLVLPHRDVSGDRPLLLPHAAMAAEDSVLWLTEAGLGTCWLGGFNHEQIRVIMQLGEDIMVPAIIPFGKPKPVIRARDYDSLLYRRVSRHRKPLSEIAYIDDIGHPYSTRDMAGLSFSASPTQDVNGLLRQLAAQGPGGGDVPLELALEACLEAARMAPSASNAQRWHFILVNGKDETRDLARACGSSRPWRAAIVGASLPGRMEHFLEKPFWMIDVPVAFSNMSLMAASMDLAVEFYTGGFDEEKVIALTKLQHPLRTVGVMGIR